MWEAEEKIEGRGGEWKRDKLVKESPAPFRENSERKLKEIAYQTIIAVLSKEEKLNSHANELNPVRIFKTLPEFDNIYQILTCST